MLPKFWGKWLNSLRIVNINNSLSTCVINTIQTIFSLSFSNGQLGHDQFKISGQIVIRHKFLRHYKTCLINYFSLIRTHIYTRVLDHVVVVDECTW